MCTCVLCLLLCCTGWTVYASKSKPSFYFFYWNLFLFAYSKTSLLDWFTSLYYTITLLFSLAYKYIFHLWENKFSTIHIPLSTSPFFVPFSTNLLSVFVQTYYFHFFSHYFMNWLSSVTCDLHVANFSGQFSVLILFYLSEASDIVAHSVLEILPWSNFFTWISTSCTLILSIIFRVFYYLFSWHLNIVVSQSSVF